MNVFEQFDDSLKGEGDKCLQNRTSNLIPKSITNNSNDFLFHCSLPFSSHQPLPTQTGRKNYKRMYSKKRGAFPGGFGMMKSGRGALGLRGLGGGGLNGVAGLGGLGGVKIATNIAGRAFGVSDRLGTDLFGRYGLLSPAGIDDIMGGFMGDVLFSPGALIGLGPLGRRYSSVFGVMSGMCELIHISLSLSF